MGRWSQPFVKAEYFGAFDTNNTSCDNRYLVIHSTNLFNFWTRVNEETRGQKIISLTCPVYENPTLII